MNIQDIAPRLALLLWVGIVAEAALIVLVALSLSNGTINDLGVVLVTLAWSMLPLAAIAVLDWAWRRHGLPRLVCQIAAVLALIAGAWFYIDATWIHLSSLSGLVFVVTPLWQWGALLTGAVVAALLHWWMKRRASIIAG